MPQSRKRFRRRSGGMVSRKRRRTRSLRRFPRRTHRVARRSLSRRRGVSRGRRLRTKVRTGYGITPWSRHRSGRSFRPSRFDKIRAGMALGVPLRWDVQTSGYIFSNENVGIYGHIDLGHVTDIVACESKCISYPYGANDTALLPVYKTSQWIMSNMSLMAHFKNDTTAVIRLQVWEVTAKLFTPNSETNFISILQNGFNDIGQPITPSAPNIAPSYYHPSTSPFQNPRFRSFYKQRNYINVNLMPGQRFDHTVECKSPWIVNGERLSNNDFFDYKGRTTYLLFRVQGDVGWDATNSSVVWSSAEVDFTYEKKYVFHYVPGWVSQTQMIYDGLQGSAENVENINPTTGVISNPITVVH